MNNNEKISRFFQQYKADMDAAHTARLRGNLQGARKLYRSAALALCEMANLESGETRAQRIRHAEEIIQLADTVCQSAAEESSAKPALTASGKPSAAPGNTAGKGAGKGAGKKQALDADDDDNPWTSEGVPSISFDDVVGMENVKELIRSRIINQVKYPELYNQYDIQGGTGVLLFGLPGTGKTTIARAIAHEINAPIYLAEISSILSKWVGESEKRIQQLFDKARSHPVSLIFFDDFDALGTERKEDSSHAHSNKVIVELINQMDGFRRNENTIVLLAATNKPWMIDSALMRPGRFEHHFYVPLPNHDARVMLLEKNIRNAPVEDGLDLHKVSDLLQGYNGADIGSVTSLAKMAALARTVEFRRQDEDGEAYSPITYDDFVTAAEKHRSSVDKDDIVKLKAYAAERGIALPDEL